MRIGNFNLFHAAAIAALFFPAMTAAARADSITITDPWIRALPASVPSGGYFTLHNSGDKTITLTGADSPDCGMLMLHKSSDMGGMTSMEDVATVDVPARTSVEFKPGGYHLMCMGAKPAIKPGAKIPVTLTFKDGTKVTAEFAVRNAAGK